MSDMSLIEHLSFEPPLGLRSPNFQTILGSFSPSGSPPLSTTFLVPLGDGDTLSCRLSTPINWKPDEKTVLLLHGLGGSDSSPYMIRFARKLYENGFQVLRINMRGCGSGENLAQYPYHGGISGDILAVVNRVKKIYPLSPIVLIGFSLGGNIVLKLAGELGEEANSFLKKTIAVCPSIDLAQSSALLGRPENRLYNLYFMRSLQRQGARWIGGRPFSNLYEFDSIVTAPYWGFEGAFDYYHQCSSRFWLQKIRHPCHLLFSADDPFIDYKASLGLPLPSCVKIYLTEYGGHLGFFGWSGANHYYFWMDNLLFNWIEEAFRK